MLYSKRLYNEAELAKVEVEVTALADGAVEVKSKTGKKFFVKDTENSAKVGQKGYAIKSEKGWSFFLKPSHIKEEKTATYHIKHTGNEHPYDTIEAKLEQLLKEIDVAQKQIRDPIKLNTTIASIKKRTLEIQKFVEQL